MSARVGMPFVYDDGGRLNAGFRGKASDCLCRAIAIAAQIPYGEVFDLINQQAMNERPGASVRRRGRRSNANKGVFNVTARAVLAKLGWRWTPTMAIGQGCKVHLRTGELPAGRLIVKLSRHVAAVIDGVIHDTYEDSRDGMRCVYGYWRQAS